MDTKSNLEAALAEAAKINPDNKLAGHWTIGSDGNLKLARPGRLSLGASIDRGVYVDGLKDGERLATKADLKAYADAEAKRAAKEAAAAAPSPFVASPASAPAGDKDKK
jgi:hypothetical protein